MNPAWFAIPAVCLYALGNNFTSKYLRGISPVANALLMSVCMASVAGAVFAAQRTASADARLPEQSLWWVYVILGIVYCTADILFYKAYALQGSIAFLMTLVALMPVAAVIIEYFLFKGVAPSLRQSAGIACAVLAAWLVSSR